jgi:hypothetical protein
LATKSDQVTTPEFPKGVSQPAIRALTGAGFARWQDLSGVSRKELLKLHGMGPKAIRIIDEALAEAGLPSMTP